MGFDGPGWFVYLSTGSISVSHTHKVLACFKAIFGENSSCPKRLPFTILYSLASDIVCEFLLYEMVTKGLGELQLQLLFSEQSLLTKKQCYMFQ